MRVINIGVHTVQKYQNPMCACIGYFDGMHLGHQALVKATVELAQKHDCESALITFDPDPWVTIKGLKDVKHITTMRQRINRAVELGIQNIIILDFDKEMSELSPTDFIHKTLAKLNLKGIVCGFDFHYGAHGAGDCNTLKSETEYDVVVVDAVEDEIGKISSTRICDAIIQGDMPAIKKMLGQYYSLEGIVRRGHQQGRLMGFPTANIEYSDEYLLPKQGVYASLVEIDHHVYGAMTNLGHNPTCNTSEKLSLETYLIGYNGSLYGRIIKVQLLEYLRPEIHFKSRENLILQLEQDVRDIKKILLKYE